MKRLLIIAILITCTLASWGQKKDTILLIHSYNPAKGMQMKWLPRSYQVFLEGFRSGYVISRAEIKAQNGTETRGEFVRIHDGTIKYWPVDKLKEEIKKDSTLAPAGIFITGANDLINRKGGTNIREAVDQANGEEMLHLLGSFVTISDNRMAEALGMYFTDKSYQPSAKYLYKIEIPGKSDLISYLLVFPFRNEPKEKVMGFTAKLIPGAVHLNWFNNNNKNYPYYNIYRSEKKNSGFVKLNKVPYVGNVGNAKFNNQTSAYTDSFPSYNKTYYYKIAGINAFEEEGTPSQVLEVKTLYLLQNAPVISESPDNKTITIKWVADIEEKKYIKGFTVKRAKRGEGPYRKLHKDILPPATFSFTDKTEKGSSNYYVVTAYGAAGDSVSSLLKVHLLVDSVPPAKPVMLTGVCDTNGIVTIKWKNNREEDLEGYRIFKASDKRHEPERVISGHISDTTLTDTINLKRPYNKIYYRIVALDNVFNSSVPSEFIEVILPDKTPPVNGYLKTYSTGMKGITIEWQPSNAFDLNKMYLMRKAELEPKFSPLLIMKGDSLRIATYTDTSAASGMTYQYTLVAEDEAGLRSGYSNILTIEQLNKTVIRAVTNLAGIANRDNKMIKLTWDYPQNATGFRIYRSRNNDPLSTYEYISGDKREFYDSWLKPNSKYRYLIVAELPGGFTSGYSNEIEVKY
jgi:fibronectin type 3 domain-containing protein